MKQFSPQEIEALLDANFPHPKFVSNADKWNMMLMANIVAALYEKQVQEPETKSVGLAP